MTVERESHPEPDWDTTASMSSSDSDAAVPVPMPDDDPTALVDDPTVLVEDSSGDEDPTRLVDADSTNVVADRRTALALSEETYIVEGSVTADPTVIVEEAAPDAASPMGEAPGDPTIVVDEEESTRIVRASSDGSVHEVTVTSGAGASLSRPVPVESAEGSAPPVRPAMSAPVKRRRGPLRPAPVLSGFGGPVFAARGAGARSTRSVRAAVVLPPPPAPVVEPPVRIIGRIPSAARRSRRVAVAAVSSLIVTTVAGAGGLTWSLINLARL